jgi:mannose-1-phosphate guanylyltransferase/mannose-1-phosphate guanylyltransferase/mannose-6-phosphate isomerase
MSRAHYPKQLLALVSEHSLLQPAALRVPAEAGFAAPLVIANEEHRFIIAEQLREIDVAVGAVLLEPAGHNTAAVAALRLAADAPRACLSPNGWRMASSAGRRRATG